MKLHAPQPSFSRSERLKPKTSRAYAIDARRGDEKIDRGDFFIACPFEFYLAKRRSISGRIAPNRYSSAHFAAEG